MKCKLYGESKKKNGIHSNKTRQDDELYHYGVKGMKWGVRRDIANKAKVAAALERSEKYYTKQARKNLTKSLKSQTKRINKAKKRGDSPYKEVANDLTDKEKNYINQYVSNTKQAIKMKEYRSHAIKDLSEKDIKQGRRWVYKANVIFGLPFSVARHERERAEKYIRENFS